MTSWLNKQKKSTLLELSNTAGLKQDEDTRKDDIVDNLDTFLQANSTRLAGNPSFAPYFDTRRTPFKARASSNGPGVTSDDGEVKSVVKARGRRTTKVKQETGDEDAGSASPSQAVVPTSSAVTKTPARRRRSELPPSPADVADDIEYAARRVSTGINNLYNVSNIPETIEQLQQICSSVMSVHITTLILEAGALQREVLPWKYAFDIPSIHLFGRLSTPFIPVRLPDLFQLLSSSFWTPSLLWASTSIFIPLMFAYFYNLSTRDVKRHGGRATVTRYPADPLTFNIIKAITTWVVYGQRYTFGLLNIEAPARVEYAMFGGYNGMLIGSFVGMLVSLYEAAQRK